MSNDHPPSEAPPEFMDTVFTMAELMQLTDEDISQLEDLAGEPEGTALWWQLWRLERAERGGETDGEETHDYES